jgi:DNA-binding NarL/FixJ family response regulator/AraC-like DNA-binding protein
MRTSKLSAVDNWRAMAQRAMFRPRTLASVVGVGLRNLELFVRRRSGRSLRDWLNELRLRIAAQGLAAGAPISELVSQLGYCDRSHFRRQFRQMFHRSPRRFATEWKQREAKGTTQGGAASAAASPSHELAEAVRAMETRLRSDQARDREPGHRAVRIALVDEDPSATRAVQEAFTLLAPDWQLESYRPCKEDVRRLAEEPPSMVLLGCRRPKKARVDYLALITARLPAVSVIIYAASPDGDQILSDVSAGARGYVLKTAPPRELVRVIREVLTGRESFCQQAQETLVKFPREVFSLCQRAGLKRQVCEIALLLLRHPEKEIALRLDLPTNTIYALAKEVFARFHVRGRRELVGALARRR